MAELIRKLEELKQIPRDTHLFCPRVGDDSTSLYYDSDIEGDAARTETAVRIARIKETAKRKELFFDCVQILAFDGDDAAQYQNWLKDRMREQLTTCDICVRTFHRDRFVLKQQLDEQYSADEVESFLQHFDRISIDRIIQGLNEATEQLRNVPPAKRSVATIDHAGLFAIFEALSCEAFLKDEALLTQYFDEPFSLIQTKKKLRLSFHVPAMTRFLFSADELRNSWAYFSWDRMKRKLSRNAFDWAVRDPLFDAMLRVQMSALDGAFLPTFWAGAHCVLEQLDKDLISNSLRALDLSIYMFALEHLSLDSESYINILGVLKLLLDRSPVDFWEAMNHISPPTVAEQVFKSPNIRRGLMQGTEPEDLTIYFGWIEPFLGSMKAANLMPSTSVIVNQCLVRYQTNEFAASSKAYSENIGLQTLLFTLLRMDVNSDNPSVGAATASIAVELVDQHASAILRLSNDFDVESHKRNMALRIIEQAVKLDTFAIISQVEPVGLGKPVDPALKDSSPLLLKRIVNAIKAPNYELPLRFLAGALNFIGVEPVTSKKLSKDMGMVNHRLASETAFVVDVLQALSDFSPSSLGEIFEDDSLLSVVLPQLFSSSSEVHQATVELLKTISSEDTRRDALRYMLETYYGATISSINTNVSRVAKRQIFAPMPAVFKVFTDLTFILCDPQAGLLRSRDLDKKEIALTETFWNTIWEALKDAFEHTESWSNLGHDKGMMMDFCRDTMQLADQIFDQLSIFVSAITGASTERKTSVTRRLLAQPMIASVNMVRWLRLRDDYLNTKCVSLTSSMLRIMKSYDINVPENALVYICDIHVGSVKSAVSQIQKAELQTALEAYTGKIFAPPKEDSKQRRNGKPVQFSDYFKVASAPVTDHDSDDVSAESLPGAAEWRAKLEKAKLAVAKQKAASGKQSNQTKGEISEFKKQRQAEMEAQRVRQAAALAKAKKAHEPKEERSDLYVSSDDDEDEIDLELFGLGGKKKKAPSKGPSALVSSRPLIDVPRAPVKKQRHVRSVKDMRARLAPNLTPLHKTILGWDYFHDGDFPPDAIEDQYKEVANKFRSAHEYQAAFRPLLTLEAWQGFVKAREESTFKPYEIKLVNRSSVDAFQEVSSTMTQADNKELSLSEGDIILLSKGESPATMPQAPHCLARIFRIVRKKNSLEVSYRVMPGNPLQSGLTPGAIIWGAKIQSITPLEREFGALLGLQYYDLCDEIVQAKPSPLLDYTDKTLRPLIKNYQVNTAQAKAIQSAIDNDAFTLIQGPPGSGKTKTIVAVVGALLSDAFKTQGTAISIPSKSGGKQNGNAIAPAKKLLVCAPSNAAVDELVIRFKQGIKTLSEQEKKVNIVRLGRSDAINANVQDVTLDELVSAKLGLTGGFGVSSAQREETQKIFQEHQAVSESLRQAREDLDKAENTKGGDPDAYSKAKSDFEGLRRRKAQLSAKIEAARDAEQGQHRQAELNRRRAQQQVLDEAHIICATLSGSGHEMFQSLNIEFETVVVDEAAQCVEMSAIIPLKYGCAKCILVGDTKQLPPTVFSKQAAKFQYERSLFLRMQNNHPKAIHLLDTQYRMHPEISAFPSATFYDKRLLDGPNMASLRERPWHVNPILGPYRFFDVQGQHQAAPKGHSLINIAEISYAIELYHFLSSEFRGQFDLKSKVGIITPYKSQLRELKSHFSRRYGQDILERVEFNTTDAFQGRECEVIIFSCVRASRAGGIGFLQDIRRMNVGLTRAKSSLWVLGNSDSLMRGEFWKKLVDDAKARGRYTEGNLSSAIRVASKSIPNDRQKWENKGLNDQTRPAFERIKTGEDAVSLKTERRESTASAGSKRSDDSSSRVKSEIEIKNEPGQDRKRKFRNEDEDGDNETKTPRSASRSASEEDIMSKLDSHLAGEPDMPKNVIKAEHDQIKQERKGSIASSNGASDKGSEPAGKKIMIKKKKDVDPFIKRQPPKKPKPS